jgi:NHL repeat
VRMLTTAWLILLVNWSPALAGEVKFISKPTATRTGKKVKIRFSVSAPTDVAVYIENAKGEVIRHLVAGVLGKKAPAPLKPGLSQEIEWDGEANYGKPATGGPFKVRVGLGLGTKYDRVVHSTQPDIRHLATLATGPDGKLYTSFGGKKRKPAGAMRWRRFSRNAEFESALTVVPGADAAKYFGWDSDRYRPDLRRFVETGFETDEEMLYSARGSDAVIIGPEGRFLYQLGVASPPTINRYPLTATCPGAGRFSVKIDASTARGFKPELACLVMSSDGKTLFFGGLTTDAEITRGRRTKQPKNQSAAVYAVSLPERTGVRVLFGKPDSKGNDQTHLGGAPSGLAVDGKGRLFVADKANNRVLVVNQKDGKYLTEIPIEKPLRLSFSRRTGSLYVLSVRSRKAQKLSRFNLAAASNPKSWKSLKPAAVVPLKKSYLARLALDDSATPTVIWVGANWTPTLRIEDAGSGTSFGRIRDVSASKYNRNRFFKQSNIPCGDVQVDRLRKEVYFRAAGNGNFYGRFTEKTGKTELVEMAVRSMQWGGTGLQVIPAPNGNLYGIQWSRAFYQFDRSGKPLAWEEPRRATPAEDADSKRRKIPHVAYAPVSMSGLPHMLGVRWSDGHLFFMHPLTTKGGARTFKAMHEYLPSGKRVTTNANPIVWKISDAALGPKFDAAGNIYVAEALRPEGWLLPDRLKEYFTAKGLALKPSSRNHLGGKIYKGPVGVLAGMYGSILKFSPKGGMVHWKNRKGKKGEPYTGTPRLDPALKTLKAAYMRGGAYYQEGMKITGAEWIHPGIGHVGFYRCNCENVTFDVDEFGRVFFPDTPQFQVRVIDTAGNAITSFGDFGDENHMGSDSPVVDPKTNRVRPRRTDDPKAMKSPFATPEIAFSWLVGVGVTDRYAYMGDSLNQRLLRAKLVYAAEETCAIK